ncbi:MAG: hypothetical protein IT519_02575 [Burkholderiales bacterium]|nr:hypothetical protein [Burkholderiales bacterium]
MSQRSVVILSGVRTAIGDYGGSLKDIAPAELGARVVREAIARSKADPAEIGQCVIGNVIPGEARDRYISRVVGVNGGLPHSSGAMTVIRPCGSGLQAIVSASQYILLGDTDAAIGGGAKSMSRAACANTTQRRGESGIGLDLPSFRESRAWPRFPGREGPTARTRTSRPPRIRSPRGSSPGRSSSSAPRGLSCSGGSSEAGRSTAGTRGSCRPGRLRSTCRAGRSGTCCRSRSPIPGRTGGRRASTPSRSPRRSAW